MIMCYDCGLVYASKAWMDAVVSDSIWKKISPNGDSSGILCISCMARRCVDLDIRCPVKITSGPFA